MKVVIYGFGRFGRKIYDCLKKEPGINIVNIIDNRYQDKEIDDDAIDKLCSLSEFMEHKVEVDNIIVAILNPRDAFSAWESIKDLGITIYRVPTMFFDFFEEIKASEVLASLIDITKNNLPYLEMHIQDNCNLNCKGCAHYAPLFEDNELSFEEFERDIKQLRSIFSGDIFEIRLMGGEPLLNNQLDKFIKVVRYYFKYTDIRLVSNALLLNSIRDEAIQAIALNNITIDVSEYPPNLQIRERIDLFAVTNKIRIHWVENTRKDNNFSKTLSLVSNPQKERSHCENNLSCINVYRGRYAKCPQLMYINKFNSFFKTDIPNSGIYDLYNEKICANNFIENIKRTEKICGHCNMTEPKWIEWTCYSKGEVPLIQDWLIDEDYCKC